MKNTHCGLGGASCIQPANILIQVMAVRVVVEEGEKKKKKKNNEWKTASNFKYIHKSVNSIPSALVLTFLLLSTVHTVNEIQPCRQLITHK